MPKRTEYQYFTQRYNVLSTLLGRLIKHLYTYLLNVANSGKLQLISYARYMLHYNNNVIFAASKGH